MARNTSSLISSASFTSEIAAPSFGVSGRTANGQRSSAAERGSTVELMAFRVSLSGHYHGQIYPLPVGLLKHPTDSGNSIFGSHKTTSGKNTQKAMVSRNTM